MVDGLFVAVRAVVLGRQVASVLGQHVPDGDRELRARRPSRRGQFAADLGLDLAKYDSDYASTEVSERVRRDVEDGKALGVGGTPTLYVDGTPTFCVDGTTTVGEVAEDFESALDGALSD